MRQARFIAPWHCAPEVGKSVSPDEGSGSEGEGKSVFEPLAIYRGRSAIYHCVSRVAGGEMLFDRPEKERFVRLMRCYEKFTQVRVLTFCVMSNHFHILLEVPQPPEDGGKSWSDEELLKHLSGLYKGEEMAEIRWRLGHYREQGWDDLAEAYREKFFGRMWNLSAFMKSLKQRFTQWYNRRHTRRGYLWGERFKSVLVEGGQAAQRVAAYIDLNPVRANIVGDPKDYRWNGYSEAMSGKGTARAGLTQVLFGANLEVMNQQLAMVEVKSWEDVSRAYRVFLFEHGEESGLDGEKKRKGIDSERVAEVLKEGGKVSESEALRCRVRHFVDGLVLGRAEFVNEMFHWRRERFGKNRKDGARKLKGVSTELCAMRDLQREAVVVPGKSVARE